LSKKEEIEKPADEIELPSPLRILCGAFASYWLRDIINPAFTFIAIMILLMIPVIIADKLVPKKRLIVGMVKKKDDQKGKEL